MSALGNITKRLGKLALAIAGAGLGIALDRFADLDIGIATTTLAMVSLLTIVVFMVGETQSETLDSSLKSIEENSNNIKNETNGKIDLLEDRLVQLGDRFGLSIDMQLTDELNKFTDPNKEDRIAEIVREAKTSVRMLDLIDSPGVRADALVSDTAREAYFNDLNELATRQDPGFSYRRVVQSATPEKPLLGVGDPYFLDHARKMSEEQAKKNPGIALRATPIIFPYKFILIDDDIVVLQLQRKGETALELDCEVLIVDPSRRIYEVFERMWQEVEDHPEARAIPMVEIDEAIENVGNLLEA